MKKKTAKIIIGKNLIKKVSKLIPLGQYSTILIVADKSVRNPHLKLLSTGLLQKSHVLILPPGEESKKLESVELIWKKLHDCGADRSSLVIALGGGSILDVVGFAAATYMRGVQCLYIPTTLLSQADASIGGKTAIDFSGIKNLVGTFTEPIAVISDINTLKTLKKRDLISGFAEVLKHGLITDKKYFEKLALLKPSSLQDDQTIELIKKSALIKQKIVTGDLLESGKRKLLNFGHTIGHALEAENLNSKSPLTHGEAISLGMVTEAYISVRKGYLSTSELETIENVLKKFKLPTGTRIHSYENVLKKTKSDKKNKAGSTRLTLLKKIGEAVYDQNVSEDLIKDSLAYIDTK